MTTILTPAHSLIFGALDLLGDPTGSYWIGASAFSEGTEFGNPEPVEKEIASFLQDGAIAATESYDNREMTLRVVIGGVDSAGLAAGEEALMFETNKRNTLTWTPPDKAGDFAGVPSVFDVVTSSLDYDPNDIYELNLIRTYALTIKALPFARSATLTTLVSPAPAATTPATTVIDACTSATGWAGSPNTATVFGATAIREFYSNSSGASITQVLSLTRTGLSANMSTTPYLRIDFAGSLAQSGTGAPIVQTVKINGTTVAPVASNGSVSWYLSPVTTITSVQVLVSTTFAPGYGATLLVNDLTRSDMPQDATGQRQTYRTLAVAGSARTQGNLALADPSTGLGSVLVYTAPNVGTVAQPPLRVLRTAGGTETTDSTAVSGKTSLLSTLHTFDIPASQVPTGSYLLMARVKHASAGTYSLAWAARAKVGATTFTTPTDPSGTLSTTLSAGLWTVVTVAAAVLPVRRTGSSGYVRIEMQGPSGLTLDEAWLFNVDTGRLTWVECGDGTPSIATSRQRLFLDAASLDIPVPTVWLGNAADRSDSFGAATEMKSFGEHEFVPPSMNVFTVTSASVATSVTLSYFKRAHTHMT